MLLIFQSIIKSIFSNLFLSENKPKKDEPFLLLFYIKVCFSLFHITFFYVVKKV